MKTRIHGDYHLGQVLFVQNDFQIIDFEGEPARPMEERRYKHTPFKDLAGMVRSFDYAAAAAAKEIGAERAGVAQQIRGLTRSWRDQATQEYLQAYRRAMEGVASFPADDIAGRQLLDFFLIEKALYELKYELANRPDWSKFPSVACWPCWETMMLDADLRAILRAEHGNPFAVLGMHQGGSTITVRAFIPWASRIEVIDSATGEVAAGLTLVDLRVCSSATFLGARSRSAIDCAPTRRWARTSSRTSTVSTRHSAR